MAVFGILPLSHCYMLTFVFRFTRFNICTGFIYPTRMFCFAHRIFSSPPEILIPELELILFLKEHLLLYRAHLIFSTFKKSSSFHLHLFIVFCDMNRQLPCRKFQMKFLENTTSGGTNTDSSVKIMTVVS